MIMLVSGLLTLGLVAALVGVWALWTYQGPGPATKSGGVHVVMLRRGAGLNEIASALEKAGA
ncbi:MAG: aminodeoxychorismate lyase, partial [Caulobacteraceae bacterium]